MADAESKMADGDKMADADNILEERVSWPMMNYNEPLRFIQMVLIGGPKSGSYLFFSPEPGDRDTHPKIMEYFLNRHRIVFKWERPKGVGIPAQRGDNYELIGAGYARVRKPDFKAKGDEGREEGEEGLIEVLEFRSEDYDIEINIAHLRVMQKMLKGRCSIRVRSRPVEELNGNA